MSACSNCKILVNRFKLFETWLSLELADMHESLPMEQLAFAYLFYREIAYTTCVTIDEKKRLSDCISNVCL